MTIPGFSASLTLRNYNLGGISASTTQWEDAQNNKAVVSPAVPCIYGRWCGPGCSGPGDPVDDVDKCCRSHDFCYERRGYFSCSCNRELISCLRPIENRGGSLGRWAATIRRVFSGMPCNPFAMGTPQAMDWNTKHADRATQAWGMR